MSGDWRALMRILTLGNPALADSLFDRLVHRPGKPSSGHELLALLTESLGWKLWLTTNFDNQIEEALRDQGIEPAVFELADNGPAPDASLFRDTASVVKLHGGTFGLRVDESLDVPLDKENLGRFEKYVPDNALVLVLGYGGGDRRVMSLIDHLARQHTNKKLPKILWVSREGIPKNLIESFKLASRLESIKVVNYRSGGYFLRELHARLVERHPTSRTSYPALPMVPPLRDVPAAAGPAPPAHGEGTTTGRKRIELNPADSDLSKNSVIVFKCRHAGEALLDRVQEYVRLFNGYNEIWCELADVATVRDMVASLFDEFRRLDPDVTPRALQISRLADQDFAARERHSAIKKRAGFLAKQFAAAMKRGKYLVVILSTGDLGRHPFAHDLNDEQPFALDHKGFDECQQAALGETELFYAFLKRMLDGSIELGASKLLIALSPLGASKVRAKAVNEFRGFHGPPHRGCLVHVRTSGRDGQSAAKRLKSFLKQVKDGGDGEIPVQEYVDLLVVAAIFRRPRSFINLRGAAEAFPDRKKTRKTDAAWIRRFDLMLQAFARNNLLLQIEGGFLWMPSSVRDLLYRESRPQWLRSSFEEQIVKLHETIAHQYDDLLRQSNSLPALTEVAFHLVTPIRLAGNRREGNSLRYEVLQKLCAILDRSKSILRAGPSHRVSCWLQVLEEQLRNFSPPAGATDDPEFADLINLTCDSLRDLRAEVLYRANDYAGSVEIRQQQIDGLTTLGEDPVTVALKRARYTMKQGRCLAKRYSDFIDAQKHFASAVRSTIALYRGQPETKRQAEYALRVRKAKQIRIESHLELAQLYLSRIHVWEWIRQPGEHQRLQSPDDRRFTKQAKRQCIFAKRLIDRYPDLSGLDFSRMHVRYDLTWARLHMVKADFVQAFRWLDEAHAAATVRDGPGDLGDLTNIRLQTAETLIFGAAYVADARASAPDKVFSEVKANLDQAGVALKQARSTLLLDRPDPHRWAQLCLIRAYLEYERLLLLLESCGAPEAGIRHTKSGEKVDEWMIEEQEARNEPPLDSPADTLIQQGLNALGSTCELCWRDPVRKNEILLLWLRFLIAYHFFRQEYSSNEAERLEQIEDWLRWNKAAELEPIVANEKIRPFCEDLIGKWWTAASTVQDAGATRRMRLIGIEKTIRPDAEKKLRRLFKKKNRNSARR